VEVHEHNLYGGVVEVDDPYEHEFATVSNSSEMITENQRANEVTYIPNEATWLEFDANATGEQREQFIFELERAEESTSLSLESLFPVQSLPAGPCSTGGFAEFRKKSQLQSTWISIPFLMAPFHF